MDSTDSMESAIEALEEDLRSESDRADEAEELVGELQARVDELTEERDNLKGFMEVIFEKANAAL